MQVRIPAGVKDGQRIRLRGKGAPGERGGPAGDLFVVVHVSPHAVFGRSGDNLTLTVPVSIDEAALGADISVPTLGGRGVTLKIPAQEIASYPKEFASVISGRFKQKLGDAVGLTQFGVNITTIKAGSASALRHWHEQEDEFIYLLEGELVLQENDGETVLRPGDAAGFKSGSGIAHCLINRTDRDALYLEVGTRASSAKPTRKKPPVARIARRWLPAVSQVTRP